MFYPKKIFNLSLVFLMALFLNSCSIKPSIYANNSPRLDIREYFKGNLEAYGILENRSGEVIKTFTIKIIGSWEGNDGRLEEHFIFSDGKTDQRVWQIKVHDDNNFSATAHDVVGEAKGEQYGNALRMDYVLTIPVDDKKYDIKIKDWMYLVDDDSLVNVSTMTKFGFRVGRLSIGFKKIGI